MAKNIFISHAGSESDRALEVSNLLLAAGLEPILDTDDVHGGDSFISFMENALMESDYCLLLWSAAAASGRWVREEWQSAYHRTVTTGQNFLVVGRLENLDPPQMLVPRSRIELFPELEPGVAKLVTMWQDDEAMETVSKTTVRPPARPNLQEPSGETVYVASDSFGTTFPLSVDFEAPVAVVLETALQYLGAPRQIDHTGRVGCRFEYSFMTHEGILESGRSLRDQEVNPMSLLTLLIDVIPFAAGTQLSGGALGTTFRSIRSPEQEAKRAGVAELLAWARDIGLNA